MNFANKFRVERFADHVLVHFLVASTSSTETETVSSIALPITTGGELGVALFETLLRSGTELTAAFLRLQNAVNDLNKLSATEQGAGVPVVRE